MAFLIAVCVSQIQADECHLTPVIHKLHYPGCQEKRIPSYACVGRCTSYVKVSGSKIWQAERSCMCCQESGERVAVVALDCSNSPGPKTREVRGQFKYRHFLNFASNVDNRIGAKFKIAKILT